LSQAWDQNAGAESVDPTRQRTSANSGTVHPEYTLARQGAEKFERLLRDEPYIHTLGALTGAQALQMVQAGLKAIYMSGWQVAADANVSGQTYPDQSLYPAIASRIW